MYPERILLAPGRATLAHRENGGTLHTYVALAKPQDWLDGIDFSDPAAAMTRISDEEFGGWAPELTGLIGLHQAHYGAFAQACSLMWTPVQQSEVLALDVEDHYRTALQSDNLIASDGDFIRGCDDEAGHVGGKQGCSGASLPL